MQLNTVKMKFGVVTFPGSNCDQDMVYILEKVLKQEVVSLWHKERDLKGVDMVVLPGCLLYTSPSPRD